MSGRTTWWRREVPDWVMGAATIGILVWAYAGGQVALAFWGMTVVAITALVAHAFVVRFFHKTADIARECIERGRRNP